MMTQPGSVEILLATYNGTRYLERQLESIFEQLRPGWRILIRDDGSWDGTPALLRRLAARRGDCITLLEDDGERLGPFGNFSRLLQHAGADYLMFCDQDDVWLPERISRPLERIRAVEDEAGKEVPILVHTDLAVVDEDLAPLAPSFTRFSGLNPQSGGRFNRLLIENVVTGCATTINRALARLACPIPPAVIMHDWWLALIAAACGRLEYIAEATVLYRQHSQNCIGARPWNWIDSIRETFLMPWWKYPPDETFHRTRCQAAALLRHLGERLPPQRRAAVEAFIRLPRCGFLRKRQEILRHGFFKSKWTGNVRWLAQV